MFSKQGTYEAAGMFSLGHFILLAIFASMIIAFMYLIRNKTQITIIKYLKIITVILITLEIVKIIFNMLTYIPDPEPLATTLNRFIPLYYCSLLLYALIAISFGKGKVARAGYSWLFWGGIISGIAFLIYPSSSLLEYPAYHFLSLHSIFFHTILVGTGIIIVQHKLYVINTKDFPYFLSFAFVFMALALISNKTLNTNIMFLEKPLAIGFLENFNNATPVLFRITFFVGHLFLPFFVTLGGLSLVRLFKNKHKNEKTTSPDIA